MGLYEYLTEYFDKKGYEYSVLDSKHYGLPFETEDYVTPEGIASFIGNNFDSHSGFGTINSKEFTKRLNTIASYYYPPRGRENP